MKFLDFKEFSNKYNFVDTIEHYGNCVLYRSSNNKYAIKVDDFERMIADIDWLSQLRHPNLIECLDISIKGNDIYIAMDWCNPIDELKPDMYINTLLSTFASMNNIGILHGDIKPQNIAYILDSNNIPVPKIIDFGLTKQCINGLFKGKAHTSSYAEPEYNDSNDQLNYNSILGDGYCLAKTIIELCERKYDLSTIKNHIDKLLEPRYSRSTISTVCESLNIPIIPINRVIPTVPNKDSNSILKSKYDKLLPNVLSIAAKKNVSVRSLILCLHNIHRTIHMMNDMSDKECILYGSTHIALASSSFDFTKIILSSWFPTSYQGKSNDIKKMAIKIINAMDGIITTPTLLDTNPVEYSLYNTIDYSYPNITHLCNNDNIDKTLHVLDILDNSDISILIEKKPLSCNLIPTTTIPMLLPNIDSIDSKNLDTKFTYINASKYLLSTFSEYTNRLLYIILTSSLYIKEMYHSIFGDKVYLSTNKSYLKYMKGNSYLMSIDQLIYKMAKNEY